MSIILGYSGTLVENCEDAWTAGANVTCSQEATIIKIGTYSAKQVTSGAGANELLCYEDFSSADLSAKTYVALWLYSTIALAAGDIQLLLDNSSACASPTESINLPVAVQASIWQRIVFPIATPANCTAIVSVGIKQITNLADFTFYIDDVRAFNAKSFDTLKVKGIDDPESVSIKAVSGDALDFSRYKTVCSSRRNPTVNLHVQQTKTNRVFLFNFFKATDSSIFYGSDEVLVDQQDPSFFDNEWLDDCELTKVFNFNFVERTAWTTNPSSWDLT